MKRHDTHLLSDGSEKEDEEDEHKYLISSKNSSEENNDKYKKVREKKYLTIDIEEDIETNNSNIIDSNTGLTDVKYRKFNNHAIIEKPVLYDGYELYEDPHKPSNYPKIINYRCSNYRKNERILNYQFCNALLKRKE